MFFRSNRKYSSFDEENQRKEIFEGNLQRIQDFRETNPQATFEIGINHLSDRYIEEILSSRNMFDSIQSEESDHLKLNIPIHLDWRHRNVTTPVQDQGSHSSAAAIVAVEVIESYNAINNHELIRGSIDQVAICCGNTTSVFDCILEKLHGGICAQNVYNTSSGSCDHRSCQPFFTFTEVNRLESRKESAMLDWIQNAPLFVTIDASRETFISYTGGIYNDDECANSSVQHVVQLVGYGYQSGVPYWLLKNSWGENWGENGYIRMERGKNMCGITSYVVQIPPKNTNNQEIGRAHV